MSEAIRQHKRMAMGENISGQASGKKTRDSFAKGGSTSHGHAPMHHPKGHHGSHKRKG